MFDQERIEIECPNGHAVQVTIREARRRSRTIRCRRCGATIALDGRDLDRTLRDAERQLRNLGL